MSRKKEKEVTETINERVNSIIEKEGHTIATFAKKIGVPLDHDQLEYRIWQKCP